MQTSLYAVLLVLFYIALSVNVIRGRHHHSIALGDGNLKGMKARIRAHANFAEYGPLFILLLAIAEYQGLPKYGINGFGILFILCRLFHAYGLLVAEPLYKWFKPRIIGMVLTFACLGGLATVLLYQWLLLK